jgi:hypothetical protein
MNYVKSINLKINGILLKLSVCTEERKGFGLHYLISILARIFFAFLLKDMRQSLNANLFLRSVNYPKDSVEDKTTSSLRLIMCWVVIIISLLRLSFSP